MSEDMNKDFSAAPDSTMDLSSFMKKQQEKKAEAATEETATAAPSPVAGIGIASTGNEEVHIGRKTTNNSASMLDDIMKQKAAEGVGMVVKTEDLELQEKGPDLSKTASIAAREIDLETALTDGDERLEIRKKVVLINRPKTRQDYADCESELDSVTTDENGNVILDYKTVNAIGEEVTLTPKFFVVRTEEYGPYNEETESLYSLGRTPEEVKTIMKTRHESSQKDMEANYVTRKESEPEDVRKAKEENKKQLVQILIDKTGYGTSNIEFTPKEKQQVYESDEILVTSVRKLDLKSIRINSKDKDAPKKSFLQTARENQASSSCVSVVFVGSGFRADIKGMSYGELSDVVIPPDTAVTFDMMYRRVTVLYNKMVNMSRDKWVDIDDFMKNFCYFDFEIGMWGLLVATFPEIQTMGMRCGSESCNAAFNHRYRTRELLRFEYCSDGYLERFRKLIHALPSEYQDLVDNAPVHTSNYVEFPTANAIIEFAPITLYDYMYKMLPLNDEDELTRIFGNNISDELKELVSMASGVRRVLVADEHGGYDEFDELKDMVDFFRTLTPEEMKLARSIANATVADLYPLFAVKGIKCPVCGAQTPILPITDVGEMVFRAHEQQENTIVDVKKWLQI